MFRTLNPVDCSIFIFNLTIVPRHNKSKGFGAQPTAGIKVQMTISIVFSLTDLL